MLENKNTTTIHQKKKDLYNPYQNPNCIFIDNRNICPHFIETIKGPQIAKTILKRTRM